MTKWLLGFALLWAGIGTGWYLLHRSCCAPPGSSAEVPANALPITNPETPLAAHAASPVEFSSAVPAPGSVGVVTPAVPVPVLAPPAAPHSVALPPCDLPAATVLENMRTAFQSDASMFGANPVGTNPEITRALNGENPKQARFLNPDYGLRINGQGELVDAWGTPFFFHQLSGTLMEIHSAGPDRTMWTADDLVTK
jgi:hypothetical protein